eukprot:Tamp_25541.p1 GENE.Tamp_25541~~Tamp_25541.p1  ORF type:complete len:207 (-),score=33.36 Tamp_25541:218-838(-)
MRWPLQVLDCRVRPAIAVALVSSFIARHHTMPVCMSRRHARTRGCTRCADAKRAHTCARMRMHGMAAGVLQRTTGKHGGESREVLEIGAVKAVQKQEPVKKAEPVAKKTIMKLKLKKAATRGDSFSDITSSNETPAPEDRSRKQSLSPENAISALLHASALKREQEKEEAFEFVIANLRTIKREARNTLQFLNGSPLALELIMRMA